MSLPKELRELQEKRSKLEDESVALQEQQRKLEEKARALEQKIMEELNTRNQETRQNISDLESRVSDLEQRLGQITEKPTANESTAETVPTQDAMASDAVTAEINQEALEEVNEDVVEVTSVNGSEENYEEETAEAGQGSDKKKRRFL